MSSATIQYNYISMNRRFLPLACLFLACSMAHAADEKPLATFIELPWRYVIGGRANGQWLNSEAAGKRLPGTKTDYRVFTLAGEQARVSGGKASQDAEVCPGIWMLEVTPEPDLDQHAIGVVAPWNPMPRIAKAAATTQEVYLKIVRDLVTGKGITKPKAEITQLLRVDLDNDGEDEVLLSASHFKNREEMLMATGGDYSFVALRQMVEGKVQTQVFTGEFYPKADENAAPNIHEVAGLLDLDGDGTLEVLVRSTYYEGGGISVWQLQKGKLVKVLEIQCGV